MHRLAKLRAAVPSCARPAFPSALTRPAIPLQYNKKLGSGAFKDVYLAFNTEEGIDVAWNTIKLSRVPENERKRIESETKVLSEMSHPSIIKFYDWWQNDLTKEVCFTTEIVQGGSLKAFIARVPPVRVKVIKRWSRQILGALKYLHEQTPPIIHRDLKCDNIFINSQESQLLIGDFGLAGRRLQTTIGSLLGTPEFMAPEMYDEKYTETVDVYAFGMCVLEMATKDYPYSELRNAAQIFKKVYSHQHPDGLARIRTRRVREFIRVCLMRKERRPSASQLLNHAFLAPHPNDNLEVKTDPKEEVVAKKTDAQNAKSESNMKAGTASPVAAAPRLPKAAPRGTDEPEKQGGDRNVHFEATAKSNPADEPPGGAGPSDKVEDRLASATVLEVNRPSDKNLIICIQIVVERKDPAETKPKTFSQKLNFEFKLEEDDVGDVSAEMFNALCIDYALDTGAQDEIKEEIGKAVEQAKSGCGSGSAAAKAAEEGKVKTTGAPGGPVVDPTKLSPAERGPKSNGSGAARPSISTLDILNMYDNNASGSSGIGSSTPKSPSGKDPVDANESAAAGPPAQGADELTFDLFVDDANAVSGPNDVAAAAHTLTPNRPTQARSMSSPGLDASDEEELKLTRLKQEREKKEFEKKMLEARKQMEEKHKKEIQTKKKQRENLRKRRGTAATLDIGAAIEAGDDPNLSPLTPPPLKPTRSNSAPSLTPLNPLKVDVHKAKTLSPRSIAGSVGAQSPSSLLAEMFPTPAPAAAVKPAASGGGEASPFEKIFEGLEVEDSNGNPPRTPPNEPVQAAGVAVGVAAGVAGSDAKGAAAAAAASVGIETFFSPPRSPPKPSRMELELAKRALKLGKDVTANNIERNLRKLSHKNQNNPQILAQIKHAAELLLAEQRNKEEVIKLQHRGVPDDAVPVGAIVSSHSDGDAGPVDALLRFDDDEEGEMAPKIGNTRPDMSQSSRIKPSRSLSSDRKLGRMCRARSSSDTMRADGSESILLGLSKTMDPSLGRRGAARDTDSPTAPNGTSLASGSPKDKIANEKKLREDAEAAKAEADILSALDGDVL